MAVWESEQSNWVYVSNVFNLIQPSMHGSLPAAISVPTTHPKTYGIRPDSTQSVLTSYHVVGVGGIGLNAALQPIRYKLHVVLLHLRFFQSIFVTP